MTLTDNSGLQADGTALLGDTLGITYGSEFGTVSAITWYVNGAVKKVGSIDGGAVNGLLQQPTNDRGWIGEVYAIVENTNKDKAKAKTNTITVTDVEQPIEVSGIGIIDDYATPEISYNVNDTLAVITVTMSKKVDGDLYIYKESTSKYGDGNYAFMFDEDDFADTATKTVNKASELTAKNAIKAATETGCEGIRFQNSDGSTTFMILAEYSDGPYPTRGTTYKAVFDQEGISTDNIGATTRSDVEVSDTFTAPYVTAPESIALTSPSAGSIPKITFYNAEGEVITWLGNPARLVKYCGIDNVATYGETGSSKAKAKKTAQDVGVATIEKGVITGNAALSDSSSYFWATVTTAKGIFGAKAVTLESAIVEGTATAFASMNLVDDSTNPKDAVITFNKLKAPGTVYVIQDDDIDEFDADDVSTYVGKADVEKGDTKVTISDAITPFAESNGNIKYTAYFIPTNTDEYAKTWTQSWENTKQGVKDANATNGLTLAQIPKSIAYDEDGTPAESEEIVDATTMNKETTISDEFTGGQIKAYDQFGDLMESAQAAKTATCVVKNNTLTTTEDANAQYAIDDDGLVTVYLYRDSDVDAGDGFEVTILGSKLSITNKSGDLINSLGAGATTGWEVKLGSSTVISGPDSALGTAKVTFTAFTADIDTSATGFATYEGTFKTGATATLQSSTDGKTWNDESGATAIAASPIVVDTNVDITANTYYRLKIEAATFATTYVAMSGGKTAAAVATLSGNAICKLGNATYTANTDTNIATVNWDTEPTATDQFSDNLAGTFTFKSTKFAGTADTGKTLTAQFTNGKINKIKIDAGLTKGQTAEFSVGGKTVTIGGPSVAVSVKTITAVGGAIDLSNAATAVAVTNPIICLDQYGANLALTDGTTEGLTAPAATITGGAGEATVSFNTGALEVELDATGASGTWTTGDKITFTLLDKTITLTAATDNTDFGVAVTNATV